MTHCQPNWYNIQVQEVNKIHAIIETGGKQYKITQGQTVDVDRLDVEEGSTVELDKVLLIGDGDKFTVGTPFIEGAKVVATSQGEGRNKKIIVLKYKSKVRYTRKNGHRQFYTKLAVDKIVPPGAVEEKPVKRARRSKKEVKTDGS